jgi:ribosomal subunit interface protein
MAMQFSVTGKQVDVGEALGRHIENSLNGLVTKYFGQGIEGHAVISREAHRYCVDLSVHIGRGILVQAHEKHTDPYQAADKAADNIGKRMRRHKRRLKDHHANANGRELLAEKAAYQIFAAEPEIEETTDGEAIDGAYEGADCPVVVAEMTTDIPTLTVGEAVMRMDLGNLPTLMFRNSGHGGLNVVYRRNDGNIGWIDPRDQPMAIA